MSMVRSYGYFGPSKLDPLLIRDRAAARTSMEKILAFDFDRVVVAHGDVVESVGIRVEVHHHGMEVHRRLPDGTWVFFMDHPSGADPDWAVDRPPHTE